MQTHEPTPKPVSPRIWLSVSIVYLTFPAILIGLGGDLGWWQAWFYSVIIFLAGVGGRVLAERAHPGLTEERLNPDHEGNVKAWDKILSPLMALTIAHPTAVVAGLDHARGWSEPFPLWVNALGGLLCAVGFYYGVWAFVQNPFFSSMVRIQTDRLHRVIETGPYGLVRHPGYAGNALALVGMVLLLGSSWAALASTLGLAVCFLRTALEDDALMEELPGYRVYAARVRWRLIPFVW